MSKTQLQTNNSKLSELITELQGKAAGGGSGGGGDFVSGSFTPTTISAVLYNNPMEITGLGFKARQVIVRLGDHSGGSLGSTNAKSHLVHISKGAYDDREMYQTTGGVGSKATGTRYNLEITDDGFKISSNSSAYEMKAEISYAYIAIR